MTSPTTPLLADERRDSAAESDRLAESEDLTLRGETAAVEDDEEGQRNWIPRLREIILFVWALLATAAVLVLAVIFSHKQQVNNNADPYGKRNLVFMVSDGMGPASLSMTRSFRQYIHDLPIDDTLVLDQHFWGTSRTRSSSSLVTDSAAGATAFSCAQKSYNGAIAMLPDATPCGTVLEAAKRAGYMTGLVVTTDITDATPACFSSHVGHRSQEDEIALQQVGQGPLDRVVDLMFGGGRCHFLPNSTEGSCRGDDTDVIKLAQMQYGWNYISDRAGFDEFWQGDSEVPLPMMGLFAPTDIPFEIDRRNMNEVYPSLTEMAKTAMRTLERATKDSDKGFFLMIEGSRIDHGGHENDPAAQVHEVLAYDSAMQGVLEFIEDAHTPTVMVSTSDHETGGLALAYQVDANYPQYLWYPGVLANVTQSSSYLGHKLHAHMREAPEESMDELKQYINNELVVPGLGIDDATEAELSAVATFPELAQPSLAKMISVRAQIGWSTHGHSAVDVNIYSSGGPGTNALRRNVENTDVGEFLRNYLDVNVKAITKELNEKMESKPQRFGLAQMTGGSVAGMSDEVVSGVLGGEEDHWAAHEATEARLESEAR